MRIATWNIEWMTALFDPDGVPLADAAPSARQGVSRAAQLEAIGIVLTALDADAVLIVEAPDDGRGGRTVAALEAMAAAFSLRCRSGVIGFANHTQQEIALLHDPDVLAARHDPQGTTDGRGAGAAAAPAFDDTFRIDLDIDAAPELVRFSKPPLELAVTPARGVPFRMIGVHVKSKAPHGAEGPDAVTRRAIAARRKQLAQCIWLRRRVEAHLRAGEPLVLLGDLNDGPGLDEWEALFGRSGVEIVLGTDAPAALQLHDPHIRRALAGRLPAQPATARFYLEDAARYLPALLDYVMVSADLRPRARRWRIWHPFDDPALYAVPELREALLTASDHFPVTLDLAP